MTAHRAFYDRDLAYIHDVGFSGFAEGATLGLLDLLGNAGIRDGLVVDLGCGSGVWCARLVEAGYEVLGVDISPAMVSLARQRALPAEFQVGSIWSHPLPRCRAITALGEVVCYRSERATRRHDLGAWARKMFASLEPGGLLIFDVAELGLDRNRQPTFVEGDDWACLVRFQYDAGQNRLVRHITSFRRVERGAGAPQGLYRRTHECHVLQLYRAAEVVRSLRTIGFRVRTTRTFGSYQHAPGRIAFIARKP